jgi:hypothetical protein
MFRTNLEDVKEAKRTWPGRHVAGEPHHGNLNSLAAAQIEIQTLQFTREMWVYAAQRTTNLNDDGRDHPFVVSQLSRAH